MEINSEVSAEFLYARFAYSIIHILRITAMIEPMAQIAVRPSIHKFVQYCSMRGREKARHAASQGSSEPSIPEFNKGPSMCPITVCMFANFRRDVFAFLDMSVDTTQETNPGEQDDSRLVLL